MESINRMPVSQTTLNACLSKIRSPFKYKSDMLDKKKEKTRCCNIRKI